MESHVDSMSPPPAAIAHAEERVSRYGWKALAGSVIGFSMDGFDMLILADGGGIAGQAGAIKLGIARALVEFNAELRGKLKQLGFLTRDPRKHERKKYGQKGARKRFQFSKR